MAWREESDCEEYGIRVRVNPKIPPAPTAFLPSLCQHPLHHYTLHLFIHQEFEARYDTLEIEFCLLKEDSSYTHGMVEQGLSERWYVH